MDEKYTAYTMKWEVNEQPSFLVSTLDFGGCIYIYNYLI